ncbi:MAG: hypothetical protein SFY80_06635 [Verrucomicrobiota bacterium]|nr:hypothetical protein [Verrucomicrobiota bacterium]
MHISKLWVIILLTLAMGCRLTAFPVTAALDFESRGLPQTSDTIQGFIKGDAGYVAYSTQSLVLFSADGQHWDTVTRLIWRTEINPTTSARENRTHDAICSGLYADGVYRLFGRNGGTYTSTDGRNWQQTGFPPTQVAGQESSKFVGLAKTAYGNGMLVRWVYASKALKNVTHSEMSTDYGLTWTEQSNEQQAATTIYGNLIDLVFIKGYFYKILEGSTTSNLQRSSDGLNWEDVTPPAGGWLQRLATNGQTIALLSYVENDGFVIWKSSNGATWTLSETLPLDSTQGWGYRTLAYFNGRWIVAGDWHDFRQSIATSRNLVDWTISTATRKWPAIYSLTAFDNIAFAGGTGGQIQSTTNGANWTSATPDHAYFDLRAVTHGNERFVAVGGAERFDDAGNIQFATSIIEDSIDGRTWNRQLFNLSAHLRGVAYGNGVYVVIGPKDAVLVSANGVDWAQHAANFDGIMQSVAYGSFNGQTFFLAGGDGGACYTSVDGINWSKVATGDLSLSTIQRVRAWPGGGFVLAGREITSASQGREIWLVLSEGNTLSPIMSGRYTATGAAWDFIQHKDNDITSQRFLANSGYMDSLGRPFIIATGTMADTVGRLNTRNYYSATLHKGVPLIGMSNGVAIETGFRNITTYSTMSTVLDFAQGRGITVGVGVGGTIIYSRGLDETLPDWFPIDANWSWHAKLGFGCGNFFPWLYIQDHGWWYYAPIDAHGFWAYDLSPALEWLYVSDASYPFVYSTKQADWLYYEPGSKSPRRFYRSSDSQLIEAW